MEYLFPIAGVQFKIIEKEMSLPASAFNHSIFRQFFLTKNNEGLIDSINVYLTDEPAPRINQLDRIFDSQTSWSIYICDEELFISDEYPIYHLPVWIARFHSKENQVTLYCSSEIIDQKKKQLLFNPFTYPLDQILLMNFLAEDGCGVIFHSAGWVYDDQGVIFAGKSGAGKSTISNLFHKMNQGIILSDDRIAVRKFGYSFLMYGTPWPGEGGFAVNQSAPLKCIVFLKQGNENKIVRLKTSEAMPLMFPVMSIPWYDRQKVSKMMDFCESLLENIPMYELIFRADETATNFVKEFMAG